VIRIECQGLICISNKEIMNFLMKLLLNYLVTSLYISVKNRLPPTTAVNQTSCVNYSVLLSSCFGLGLNAPRDRRYPVLVLVLNHCVLVLVTGLAGCGLGLGFDLAIFKSWSWSWNGVMILEPCLDIITYSLDQTVCWRSSMLID